MEPSFEKFLFERGIHRSGIKVLTDEKILSRHIFSSLKEEHIIRLLKAEGMSIGSHALLWELWESERSSFGE